MPPNSTANFNTANVNAMMMGAVKDLTQQLLTLNQYYSDQAAKLDREKAQQHSDDAVAAMMATPLSTRVFLPPGVEAPSQVTPAETPPIMVADTQKPYLDQLQADSESRPPVTPFLPRTPVPGQTYLKLPEPVADTAENEQAEEAAPTPTPAVYKSTLAKSWAERSQHRTGLSKAIPFLGGFWSAAQANYATPGAPEEAVPMAPPDSESTPPASQSTGQLPAVFSLAPSGGLSSSASVVSNDGSPAQASGGSDNPLVGTGHMTDTNTALTMAVLGEHGGPAILRNMYLEQYGLQRSLEWARGASNYLGNQVSDPNSGIGGALNSIPGVSQQTLGTMSGIIGDLANHPVAAYAAYRTIKGIGHLGGTAYNAGLDWQGMGNELGYSGGGGGPQYFLGLHNPFSLTGTAAQEGESIKATEESLTGRNPFASSFGDSSLSSGQAKQVVDLLAAQGFSNRPDFTTKPTGDLNDIARNFMAPLIGANPGLNPQLAAEFTPALRNASTTTKDLTDSLSGLADIAITTKTNINDAAEGLQQLLTTAEGMGATQQEGINLGTQFVGATGLPTQYASAAMQNPMIQGLMMSQYGILPSGIASAGGGVLGNATMAAVQMMQKGLSGLDRDHYVNIHGRRVLVATGQSQEAAQISEMLGIPQSAVDRMLGNPNAVKTGSMLEEGLGAENGIGGNTGWYKFIDQNNRHLNNKQLAAANQYWNQVIAGKGDSYLKQMGMSHSEIAALNKLGGSGEGLAKRAKLLQHDIAVAQGNQPGNKIQNDVNVNIKMAPGVSRFFQASTTSVAKRTSNAGGQQINGIMNTPSQSWMVNAPVAPGMNANISPGVARQLYNETHGRLGKE